MSFFPGTYREVIETLGDNFTAACRLRRVRNLKEYTKLERFLVTNIVPRSEGFVIVMTSTVPLMGIEWVTV
jgi:hypothetical protein